MSALLKTRFTAIWLVLLLLTAISVAFSHELAPGLALRGITIAVVVIAFAKVWLVGMEFIELRQAPWPFRLAFTAWVVLVCAGILVCYLFPGI